jgi:hypothetical protein
LGNVAGAAGSLLGSQLGAAALGGVLGGVGGGSSQTGNQTLTTRQEIDPRMASLLYGPNGNDGLLSKIAAQSGQPANAGLSSFGTAADRFLGQQGGNILQGGLSAAQALQGSNIDAPTMTASQIAAPGQNNLNLDPAYQNMIYGNPAENPYLTGAIQKGINQSNSSFQDMLSDSTKTLLSQVLPAIRSGAIANNMYGGNRQGLAEGAAIGQYGTDLARAASRFGQNNTDAAVSAQAGAFENGQSRALSALSGLSGQQYGTATNNAQLQQQGNLANQQAALSTNSLNSANKVAGLSATQGLLGNAYGYWQNANNQGIDQLGRVSNLLQPYTGLGASSTQTQPMYENKAGNILGGATAGLGLLSAYNKATSPQQQNPYSLWG